MRRAGPTIRRAERSLGRVPPYVCGTILAMATLWILIAKYLIVLPLLIGAGLLIALPRARQKALLVFGVLSGSLAFVLARLGGYLYYDPRPFVVGHFVPLVAHVADNGFPSDHVLLASAVSAVCSYFNRKLGLLLWLITALIAFARVYVGVHHAADVFGSMVFSLIAAAVVYWTLRKWSHSFRSVTTFRA